MREGFSAEREAASKPEREVRFGVEKERLDRELKAADFRPQRVVEALKQDPALRAAFDADSGTSEGDTIERHVLKVMGQNERYFGDKDLPAGIDKPYFRLLLALHDIGKPEAISAGDKSKQHEPTVRIVRPFLGQMGYSEERIRLAEALLGSDPVGKYLKTKRNAPEIARVIAASSAQAGMALAEFYELLVTYYKVDAGSYTVDAGGKRSLDELFDFDREGRFIDFSDKVADLMDELETEIDKLDKKADES